jgi:hypothetical protein
MNVSIERSVDGRPKNAIAMGLDTVSHVEIQRLLWTDWNELAARFTVYLPSYNSC